MNVTVYHHQASYTVELTGRISKWCCCAVFLNQRNFLLMASWCITVQVKDRSQNLNCITKELIDSGRHLQDITDKKVDCLRAFVHHKKFADWLKKSLRGMMFSYLLFLVYFLFINNNVIVNTQQFMTMYKGAKDYITQGDITYATHCRDFIYLLLWLLVFLLF